MQPETFCYSWPSFTSKRGTYYTQIASHIHLVRTLPCKEESLTTVYGNYKKPNLHKIYQPTRDQCRLKQCFRANWSYARSWCREQGGDLAVIDNQYENDFVSSYLRELHYPTWIGLSDLVEENQYAWSDGVIFFTQWGPDEPTNFKNEGCVSMHASPVFHGTWNDTKCDQAKPYICKITFGTSHTD
uniref:C-type lectin domain-containing protein n=1 Tax=Monopterus albus TaxID=43700 RepID=A0A3Q3IIM9_MONAL